MMTRRTTMIILALAALGGWLLPSRGWSAQPYQCVKATSPKFIDGRFSEWTEPHIALDRAAWRPEAQQSPLYGGALDLSATMRLAWDECYLNVALAVVDDVFLPAKEGILDTGDAVLLRFCAADAGDTPPIEYVFSLAGTPRIGLREADGRLVKAADVKFGAGRAMLPVPASPLPCENGKTVSTGITKLWYELAIPWDQLARIRPSFGAAIGMEVHIQDVDGQGVRGRLKWRGMPGVARTATDLGCVLLVASSLNTNK